MKTQDIQLAIDQLENYVYGFPVEEVSVVDQNTVLITCEGDQWVCTSSNDEDVNARFNLSTETFGIIQMRNLD